MEVVAAEGVAAEIYAKHRNSTQPESQQVCAVLGAVLEVVQAEGMQPTPTTLFAAVMSSLEKPETQASAQVCLAQPLHISAALYIFPTPCTVRASSVKAHTVLARRLSPTGGWSHVHRLGKCAWPTASSATALQIHCLCTDNAEYSGAE